MGEKGGAGEVVQPRAAQTDEKEESEKAKRDLQKIWMEGSQRTFLAKQDLSHSLPSVMKDRHSEQK